jgi:hypothetical protein
MSTYSKPRVSSFKADGAIARGKAVKVGTDKQHVAVCSATTDKAIGIALNTVTTAEDQIEVALPGGGAKGLAQASFTAGQLLVPSTTGDLKKIASANDRIIAMAKQDASAGDLCDVEVLVAQATATES